MLFEIQKPRLFYFKQLFSTSTDMITRALFLNYDIPVDLSKVYELLISALLKTSIGRFLDVVTAARKFLKYLIATKEDS